MSISTLKRFIYTIGKYLADAQAVEEAIKQKSFRPIINRFLRRFRGRF
jgi:hypothetical protein